METKAAPAGTMARMSSGAPDDHQKAEIAGIKGMLRQQQARQEKCLQRLGRLEKKIELMEVMGLFALASVVAVDIS